MKIIRGIVQVRVTGAFIVPYNRFPGNQSAESAGLAEVRARASLVKRLAAASGLHNVAVFGSVARGEEGVDSDIDFLVDTSPATSLLDLVRFEQDAEQLFQQRVDVVSRESLDKSRDQRILAETVAL